MQLTTETFIDERAIHETLAGAAAPDRRRVREILAKASTLAGLDASEVAVLMNVKDPEALAELYRTARSVKETIYGSRLVLFAPLYISSYCRNDCTYCSFRARNTGLKRRALTQAEIAAETKALVDQGHKRVLLVSGESYPEGQGLQYVLDAIRTVYETRSAKGEIRRVNVNIAPLSVEDFRELKAADIGTYQLFQETYHRETYARVHAGGLKRNFDWRVTAMHRAMQAGIDDVGIGVLFGLYDWRFDVLAMMQHIASLEKEFGCGPHTISVPRLEPAEGAPFAATSEWRMPDEDFLKAIAILRLAVPYTGLVLSTRESAEIRRRCFQLGISQISAGSRTDPGGYTGEQDGDRQGQFHLGDHRSLDEVVRDVAELGFMPSFCTSCYRVGRTGADFMDMAKPGEIKYHCEPNALSTFQEYLEDYASPECRKAGEQFVQIKLTEMEPAQRRLSQVLIDRVKSGKRDVFV